MKKIIFVFAMIVFAANLFAASGDQVVVRTSAQNKKPEFVIYGSCDNVLTASNYKTSTKMGSQSGTNLDTAQDVSMQDLVAYFAIAQNNTSPEWAKEAKEYYISISATPLKNITITASMTEAPTFSDYTANTSIAGSDKGITYMEWTNDDRLRLVYNGYHKVDNAFLGGFTITWPQTPDIAAGTCAATVTMTVSTV